VAAVAVEAALPEAAAEAVGKSRGFSLIDPPLLGLRGQKPVVANRRYRRLESPRHGESRRQYAIAETKRWLAVFAWRFFQVSQFKRSCIPNAPKVGSGGSLSPRGDYRAPSDSEATAWLEEIKYIPDKDSEP
jgi:hypothetical protein